MNTLLTANEEIEENSQWNQNLMSTGRTRDEREKKKRDGGGLTKTHRERKISSQERVNRPRYYRNFTETGYCLALIVKMKSGENIYSQAYHSP